MLIRRPAVGVLALALSVAACGPREEPLPVLFELPSARELPPIPLTTRSEGAPTRSTWISMTWVGPEAGDDLASIAFEPGRRATPM